MIKDLNDKRLSQNKVSCSFSGVKLLMVKLPVQAPRRSLRQKNKSPAFCRLLALEPYWLGFFFVASSLSSLLCCLFLVASIGTLLSASWQLSSFLLHGELDRGLGHGQSGVQECSCHCRLLRVVFVEGVDHLPEVHNSRKRFPGVIFF